MTARIAELQQEIPIPIQRACLGEASHFILRADVMQLQATKLSREGEPSPSDAASFVIAPIDSRSRTNGVLKVICNERL